MFYNEEKKAITAKMLKDLREERGLSHEKLAEAMNEQYGALDKKRRNQFLGSKKEAAISVGVLKNYEVSDFNHSKFNTGYGMSISYLTMFADFYNVSTDYLLGRIDLPNPNAKSMAIHNATGLSDEAINHLIDTNVNYLKSLDTENERFYQSKKNLRSELIELLCTEDSYLLLNSLAELRNAMEDNKSLEENNKTYNEEGFIYTEEEKKQAAEGLRINRENALPSETKEIKLKEYIQYKHYKIVTEFNKVILEIVEKLTGYSASLHSK